MPQIVKIVYNELRQYFTLKILKITLITFILIGGSVELFRGKTHLENIFAKYLHQWEYFVIIFCILIIRVTCSVGIAMNDFRVSMLATVLSTLSTINTIFRPFGYTWITIPASICVTFTAYVFLILMTWT
jgi:hypothetical protein